MNPVLEWGERVRRDLPWRHTRDPWQILVSETMLAQTQVARVEPKWREFVRRWPTPVALVSDQLSELLAAWQGLGYPRRAVNLSRAAHLIIDRHGGVVPDSLDELLALPGVGPYTARAVLAFAFERDIGVVDTNIARIMARTAGHRLTPRAAQERADSLVPAGHGWAWNQSLMDLGAMRCRPVASCDECPMARVCRWRRAGFPTPDPAVGSAGVSTRQAKFEGSDRQLRGVILARLAEGSIAEVALRDSLKRSSGDDGRVDRLVADLLAEGLISFRQGRLSLG